MLSPVLGQFFRRELAPVFLVLTQVGRFQPFAVGAHTMISPKPTRSESLSPLLLSLRPAPGDSASLLAAALVFVQLAQAAVGVEDRRRQGLGQAQRVGLAESPARRTGAAEDQQAAAQGDDLAARP